MEKINSLRDYLLKELPQLKQRPETVVIHEDEGCIFVYCGSENDNFKMDYSAVLTIYDTTIKKDKLAFVFSKWIKKNYPQHEPGTLLFNSEILTDSKKDITFSLPLSETVKAQDIEGAIRLARSHDSIPEQTGGILNEVEAVRGENDSPDQP